ncbi:hypothetical protein ABQE69_09160 [Mycolicibacillus trivialis]
MTAYYDRDGRPIPNDWYDRKKHGDRAIGWGTESRVARTIVGNFTISTVWMGLDHNHTDGPPIIFETMIFGEPWGNELQRYSSEEAAMRGHLAVLDRLKRGRPPFDYLDPEGE